MSEPPFRRVAIYGLGLIGGSIALAIKRRWPSVALIAIDRPDVVDAALHMKVADEGGDSLRLANGADLVMLAAPVLQNVAAIEAIPNHIDGRALLTDAGSTKRAMADAATRLPERLPFIGGHPLAGAAASGIQAARPDLFDDRPWILTGTESAPEPLVDALSQFITGLRAIPRRLAAAEHDRLLAYVSHLPQLTVSALMHVVGGCAGPDGLSLAGRGLRDTTRLASSPAHPWRDIVATNGDNIEAALDALIAALEQLKTAPGGAPPRLDELFVSAARWKGVLDNN